MKYYHFKFKPGFYTDHPEFKLGLSVNTYSKYDYGRPHWRRICRMPCF